MGATRRARSAGTAETLARAGLGGWAAALAGAVVGYNYVQAEAFSLIVPGLIGLLCATAATRLAGRATPAVQLVSAGYAAMSALLSFRLARVPFGPAGRWLPPLAVAVLAALLAAAPPRRRQRAGTGEGPAAGTGPAGGTLVPGGDGVPGRGRVPAAGAAGVRAGPVPGRAVAPDRWRSRPARPGPGPAPGPPGRPPPR